jgi:hypothetical protein
MPLPDEGLIHAWLDGQLPSEEAERVEHLVATDPAWEAAAAEARGLVAASSRILAALDNVPRGVLPVGGTVPPSARRLPWWTKAAAAIVVIAGGSTLVLQRAPAPMIDELPRAGAPVTPKTATTTVTTTVTAPPAAPKKSSALAKQQDVVKASAPPIAAAKIVQAEASKPQALASAPAQAEAPAPVSVPSLQEARTVGGVLPSSAGGAPAQRVANQRVDAQRALEQQAAAQRDAAVRARVESPFATNKAANALSGVVVTGMAAVPSVTVGACYAMRDSKTSAATGIVMRGTKQVADTLFLAPLHTSSPMRGWIRVREGALRGVLTTEAEGRGMMLVTATRVSCTAP